ncbi:MAG: hypothetical protein ACJAUA_000271 [Zhongshania aliphaticivorans]
MAYIYAKDRNPSFLFAEIHQTLTDEASSKDYTATGFVEKLNPKAEIHEGIDLLEI